MTDRARDEYCYDKLTISFGVRGLRDPARE